MCSTNTFCLSTSYMELSLWTLQTSVLTPIEIILLSVADSNSSLSEGVFLQQLLMMLSTRVMLP